MVIVAKRVHFQRLIGLLVLLKITVFSYKVALHLAFMKTATYHFILLLVLISAYVGSIASAGPQQIKRFAWEEGSVTYQVSGACTGTEVLKWKEFGFRKAIFAKNKLNLVGFTQETETLMLSNGSIEYSINLKEKTGTKKNNPLVQQLYKQDDSGEIYLSEQVLMQQGATKLGKKTILDTSCTSWELVEEKGVTTTCLTSEGIPLEIISSVPGGTHHSIAVSFNQGEVPDADVSLPTELKIKNIQKSENEIVQALRKTEQSSETLNCLAHEKTSILTTD